MTALPARVAGVPEVVLCAPPGADGDVHDAILAAAALAGVDDVYRGRRRPGDRRAGLRHRDDRAGRRDRRSRATRTSPRPSARSSASSGSTGSPGRRRSRSSPTRTVEPDVGRGRPARAGRARSRRRGRARSCGTPRSRTRVELALEALLVDAPSAATKPTSTLDAGGRVISSTIRQRDRRRERDRARAPRADVRRRRRCSCRSCATRARCSSARYAPAVIGDYVAGTNHVLPTGGTARFASALRVADFRKHMHVVHADEAALRRVARGRRAHRIAEAEGLAAHADADPPARGAGVVTRAPAASAARRPARARGLPLAAGRRATCGSTPTRARTPPPAEFVERWRRGAARRRLEPLSRSRRAGAARRARCVPRAARRSGCSVRNGSNEVLQTLLLTYGGTGRRALMFEPTYALHAQIARGTATEIVAGERRRRLHDRSRRRGRDRSRARSPSVVFVCSPNNPTGTVEPRATVERLRGGRGRRRARCSWSTRPTASSRRGARSSSSTTSARSWSCAPTRRCGRSPAVRLGFAVAPAWVIAELEKVLLPYNLSVPTQLAGDDRARLPPRRWNSGSRRSSRSGAGCSRRWPTPTASTSCPSGANFLLFRVAGDAHDLWKRLLARDVLVRDFSSWPRVEGCLRVTVGTPGGERRVPRRARRGPAGGRHVSRSTRS